MGLAHLVHVVDEDELGEVVVDGSLGQVATSRRVTALLERCPAQGLVLGAYPRPGGAPVLPSLDLPGDALEVRHGDAVGREARRPVGYG
jgi:hypothetical protein